MTTTVSPPVIVLERRGDWALALRQAWQRRSDGDKSAVADGPTRDIFARAKLSVRETRSAEECFAALQAAPDGLLLLVWDDARSEPYARLLARRALLWPHARVVVVGNNSQRPLERLWRELGVVEVVYTLCEADRVAALIARLRTAESLGLRWLGAQSRGKCPGK